jgi:anaerobic magnesium-protoporphyrin IX monomethyl ester cyclase
MKVLFINPPFSNGSTWGDFKSVGAYNPPIGLCYLAAVLRKNKIDVKIVDAYVLGYNINEIVQVIEKYKPDLIGITSASIVFEDTKKISATIRSQFKVPLILGGPHVTIFPEDAMETGLFDCGVIGEGEEVILELISHFNEGLPINKITGIIYKEKDRYMKTKPRFPILELDKLPMPALDLLPSLDHYYPQAFTYKKRPVGYILSSRGCPFSCIYCIRIMGKRFRANSPEKIVLEVERLINEFGVEEIHFLDDCFTVDKKRVNSICDLILEKKIKFRWKCITHANFLSYDLLKKMKRAGCWYIGVGVETGDQKMMNFIKKKLDLEHLQKVLLWANSLRIAVKGFFILGFPTETIASINRTIDFSKKNPFFAVSYNIAYLNPGSEMDAIADQYGDVDRETSKVTAYTDEISFIPYGFTAENLKSIQTNAYLGFYLRPKQLIRMLLLNQSAENYFRALLTIYTILKRKLVKKLR